MYPQQSDAVMQVVKIFLRKYYNDNHPRALALGINPGRFGAGITGVNFTAPRQLSQYCGIDHPFKEQSELSAEFVYDFIMGYGGVVDFYQHFFIGSVCPLGFVQNGKNINYYDDKQLQAVVEPFIIENLSRLLTFNVNRDACICIGGEKNFKYLSALNTTHKWFKEIIPLPHPRFIMQYKRKEKQQFVNEYVKTLLALSKDEEV